MFGLGRISGQKLADALHPEIDQLWDLVEGVYGGIANTDALLWSAYQTAFSLNRYARKLRGDDSTQLTFQVLELIAGHLGVWAGDEALQTEFLAAIGRAHLAITGEWHENPTFGFLQARLKTGEHWVVPHPYYAKVLVPFFRDAKPRISLRLKR